MNMRRSFHHAMLGLSALAALGPALTEPAWAAGPVARALPADLAEFRSLYQEMIETDTSATTGSCTVLADKIEARLRRAGFTDAQFVRVVIPDHPKDGGIVAVLPGTSKTLKPMLLLGHLDVVVARREDWTRDPYTLIEEGGYFYGRGTIDMKALDSIWVDMLVRFRQQGYKPARTIKLALTCGEEGGGAVNGARWLAQNRPELLSAAFALNEGGRSYTNGTPGIVSHAFHVGEKASVNFRIEATNPGGHSSVPVPDNAIYELADALVKLRALEFPVVLSDTTRAFFARTGATRKDAMGQAMIAIAANPQDKAAEAVLNTDRAFHSMLRTTCVATMLDGGHATNALPQRAGATINCRMFPGATAEATRQAIEQAIGDPRMTVRFVSDRGPTGSPPPLDPKILGPAERVIAKYYPGTAVIPYMATGATDGIYLASIGVPSYGAPGLWFDPDSNGMHGLNERTSVQGLYTARAMLTELVQAYASGK